MPLSPPQEAKLRSEIWFCITQNCYRATLLFTKLQHTPPIIIFYCGDDFEISLQLTDSPPRGKTTSAIPNIPRRFVLISEACDDEEGPNSHPAGRVSLCMSCAVSFWAEHHYLQLGGFFPGRRKHSLEKNKIDEEIGSCCCTRISAPCARYGRVSTLEIPSFKWCCLPRIHTGSSVSGNSSK